MITDHPVKMKNTVIAFPAWLWNGFAGMTPDICQASKLRRVLKQGIKVGG